MLNLDKSSKLLIKNIFGKIKIYGDNIFEKEPKLINCLISVKPKSVLPALIEMLNLPETGKHEPCTVFAIILKLAKKDKEAINILKSAFRNKEAPDYYLKELILKVNKY